MRHPSPPITRVHYAWIIAAVTFVVLLVTAGIRATPGVLMVPLETEFGWKRAVLSMAVAINIALFGLIGPFAASVMDRWREPPARRIAGRVQCRSHSHDDGGISTRVLDRRRALHLRRHVVSVSAPGADAATTAAGSLHHMIGEPRFIWSG